MGQQLFAYFIWNYDFEIVDQKFKDRKPNFDLTLENPKIMVTIKKRLSE